MTVLMMLVAWATTSFLFTWFWGAAISRVGDDPADAIAKALPLATSPLLLLPREHHGGLGGQQPEGESLLQV